MKRSDIPGARRLQHQERWNQTVADWELFLDTTPEGCFVAIAEVEGDGAAELVVGTVTALRLDECVCWISMLLVDRDWRGQGIAKRLMSQVISAMEGTCRCLRLDATPKGQPVYEKLGFAVDYQLERWTRPAPSLGSLDEQGTPSGTDTGSAAAPSGPMPLDPQRFGKIAEIDRAAFGADRTVVLEHLFGASPDGAWIDDGGYVLGRPGEHFYQLGPLVASRKERVPALFNAGCRAAGGGAIVVDIVPSNEVIRALVQGAGFGLQRTYARMTRGPAPEEHVNWLFAIADPGFG